MDGLILIHKPAGWTSHDVVAKIRSILGTQKVGHTGTLDPDATGILPVCIGKATKLSQYLLSSDKEYRVTMKLGESTDTQDGSGRRIGGAGFVRLEQETVRAMLGQFVGRIRQTPPMFSAVKVGGTPLYQLARRGEEIPRKSREVEIREIRFGGMDGALVTFDVVCSKGTYVRTLCADLGEKLGVGGHLHRLIRLRTGPFSIENAVTLEEMALLLSAGSLADRLIPLSGMVGDLPEVRLRPEAVERVVCGIPVRKAFILQAEKGFRSGERIRLCDASGGLVGIGVALADHSQLPEWKDHEKVVKIDRILI